MLLIKRALIFLHRYLGIALAVFFLLWFLSGFVIIYTGGMPRLTEAERLEHLPDLNLSLFEVGIREAQVTAASNELPRLTTIMQRPAYVFSSSNIVFADTGEKFDSSMVSSRQIVADYLKVSDTQIERIGEIDEPDQWTLQLRQRLPLQKYVINDGLGSEVYVSNESATVVQHTTSRDRLLAWVGAIPHWLYFHPLRVNSNLWSESVIWLSALGTVLSLFGIFLLFIQFRWQRLPDVRNAVPHRGLMRWHYISGIFFGLVTTTWVFSGMLSMGPFSWAQIEAVDIDSESYFEGNGPDFDTSLFDSLEARSQIELVLANQVVKELRPRHLLGRSWLEITVSDTKSLWQHKIVRLDLENLPSTHQDFEKARVVEQLTLATSLEAAEVKVLRAYDSYYYDRASKDGPTRPLPVLRLQYDDPARTALYIDLQTAEPVYRSHRLNRTIRWLYNGFHSLDFGAFYRARPLWDVVVILLLLGGTLVSLLGAILGYRHIRRSFQ